MTDEQEMDWLAMEKTVKVTKKTRRCVMAAAWLASQYGEEEASSRLFDDKYLLADIQPCGGYVYAWYWPDHDSIVMQHEDLRENLAEDGKGYGHLVLPGIRRILMDEDDECWGEFYTKKDIEEKLYAFWHEATWSSERVLRENVRDWKAKHLSYDPDPDKYLEKKMERLVSMTHHGHKIGLVVAYDKESPRIFLNIDNEPSGVEIRWDSNEWLADCLYGVASNLPYTIMEGLGCSLVEQMEEDWKNMGGDDA